MVTISTVEDFIEALDSDPILLEAVRARLLTRDLLELPRIVAELAASQKEFAASQAETREQIAELVASQAEMREQIAQLFAGLAETREQIAELIASQAEMREQIAQLFAGLAEVREQIAELVAAQREFAASQAEMREQIAQLFAGLSEVREQIVELVAAQREFAASQSEMREQIAELFAAQAETHKQIAKLFAAQGEFATSQAEMREQTAKWLAAQEELNKSANAQLATLQNDSARLKGDHLEMRLQKKVHAMLGQRKRLRGIRVVNASFPAGMAPHFGDAIDNAADNGTITEDQRARILSTDLIVRARRQHSQETIYVSFEVAHSLDEDDVRRVVQTGEALALVFPQTEIMNFVYGHLMSGWDRSQAEAKGVGVFLERSERS